MRNVNLWLLTAYALMRCLETFWPRRKISGEIRVPYSLPLIVGAYVCVFLVVFWEMKNWKATPISLWLSTLGWLLIGLSTFGRNWAIRSLGPCHSIHIEIRDQHVLVQHGPYRYIRNPYYLSNIIEAIGLALVAKARVALVIEICIYFPLLIHRLIREEAALSQKFGSLYESYKREVPMLFPSGIRTIKGVFTMLKWKESSSGSNK